MITEKNSRNQTNFEAFSIAFACFILNLCIGYSSLYYGYDGSLKGFSISGIFYISSTTVLQFFAYRRNDFLTNNPKVCNLDFKLHDHALKNFTF